MNLLIEFLQIISAGLLGLLVGALLAEGALFVPYWKTLEAEKFLKLHKEYGPRLYKFFAPLTIAATNLAVVMAVVSVVTAQNGRWATAIAGIFAASMVGIYFVYFKNANESFAVGKISADELKAELNRWEKWHWLRVVVGILALTAALFGLAA
jgi:hypothetical protein